MAVPSPRTMLVDGGFIYVGTRNRVVSATINPDGSLPPLPTAETARVEDGDVSDMLVIGDVLYAAYTEVERLVTYRLEFGQVATGISSSSGESFSNYLTMDEDNGFIYVHAPGLGRIDTFMIRPDGFLEEFAEPQSTAGPSGPSNQ